MALPKIRFGTDGWRGVIAEDFTFERVRQVAAALAETVNPGVVFIGWDRRFLSQDFAKAVAEVMAGAGWEVRLAKTFCPTPAISLAVRDEQAAAGVVITASHNPPRWNGFKVKETFGGSARPQTTAALEASIARRMESNARLPRMPLAEAMRRGKVVEVDPGERWMSAVRRQIDLAAIARAGWRIFVDPMHGAGAGWLARLLSEAGANVTEIRGDEDPCFGGVNPEPIEENLAALRTAMERDRLAGGSTAPRIGLALDGDADRIGAFDETVSFFDSHRIFASVLRHLIDRRELPGSVGQTVSSTVMVRRLAERRGRERIETPIGFKYLAEKMLEGGMLMAGEESGGLGFSFHLPERDGAFSGLLLLEACAHAGLPPRELLETIFAEVGEWHYGRIDVHLDPSRSKEIVEVVKTLRPGELAAGRVSDRSEKDGVKFTFADDSWLLIRPSGTEPVLRIYAEAQSPARVKELLEAGQRLSS